MRLAAEGGEEEDAPILRSGESAPRAGARWGRGAQCMVLLLLLAVAAAMLLLTWPPAAAPTAAVTLAPSVAVGEDDDDVDDDYNDALFELDFNATSQASLDCERISERERTLGTLEHALKWANCGLGVNASESLALHRPWRVVLLGPLWEDKVLQQSGCLVGHGRCPFSPKCVIAHSNSISGDTVAEANVVVLFQKDAKRIINQLHGHPAAGNKPYRVLYWREARWPSVYGVQRAWFDFEMGIRDTSGIFNPGFHYPPSQMQLGIVPGVGQLPFVAFENRTGFALSIISDCRAESQRLVYLERMLGILGRDRVHQYGKCGDMELPHKPVVNAAVVIARYKFFMAFENRIMQGYVTEKLTQVLGFNVVPVYYGDPAAPNITKTPSYIRASDFATPEALAEYLLYLDAHPEEYMKYHAWRHSPDAFTDDYLDALTYRVPGPVEMKAYEKVGAALATKAAACCRLCDERVVARAKTTGRNAMLKPGGVPWSKERIDAVFFNGTALHAMLKPHGP